MGAHGLTSHVHPASHSGPQLAHRSTALSPWSGTSLLIVTVSLPLFLPEDALPRLPKAPHTLPPLIGLDIQLHLACVLFFLLSKPFFNFLSQSVYVLVITHLNIVNMFNL